MDGSASLLQTQWRGWLFDKALPLWSDAGFDAQRGLFHERLDWQARPLSLPALRLMVQARQISTFCRAALDGAHDAGAQAMTCLDTVTRLFHRGDEQPGWVFSIAGNNEPANTKRDLYAHAFILFAFGWAIRYADRPQDRRMARKIAEEIDLVFAAPNGGYLDAVPDEGTRRSQNPHMHLLEAYLVMFEATGESFYLDRAGALVTLAKQRLIDRRSGLLLEFFAPDWSPLERQGANQVQAGHLFEWAWLLREFGRLTSGTPAEQEWLDSTATHLFTAGFDYGCDHDRHVVLDSMTDSHVVLDRSARIWAQTELLRLLHMNDRGMHDRTSAYVCAATAYGQSFLSHFAPQTLNGGWIDHIDSAGCPLVDYMPASSLYHIYGAGRQIIAEESR